MVPRPGIESGSAVYKTAASPQCFGGIRVIADRRIDSWMENGQMDGASAAHPKRGGGCTKRRPVFLDVHDVKQQKFLVAVNARAFAPRMHGNSARSTRAQPRLRTRGRTRKSCRSGRPGVCYGPIGSLLPVWRRDFGPPPVSLLLLTLAGSIRSRIGIRSVRHTRLGRRPVVRTTRRWRR